MKRHLRKNHFRWIVFAIILLNLLIIIPFRIILHNSALFEPAGYFLILFNAIVCGLLFQTGEAISYNTIAIILNITAEYWNNLFGIYVVMLDGERVPTFILFLAKVLTFIAASLISLLIIYVIQRIKNKYSIEKIMSNKLSSIGN